MNYQYYCYPVCVPYYPQPANCGTLVANIDYIPINVATLGQFNLLTNDVRQYPITNLQITAPTSTTDEGTITFSGLQSNGNIIFTPVPRFLSTATFGYQITDSVGNESSAIAKINVIKTFSAIPRVLFVTGNDNFVYTLNPTNNTYFSLLQLNNIAIELTTNQGDALIYYSSPGSTIIYARDYVLTTEFPLLDVNSIAVIGNIKSLGFDQKNYFLYVGYQQGNQIMKIAVDPYDRYGTGSGTQGYSATLITIAPSGLVMDIAVQYSTGYLFMTIQNAGTSTLYKIDPITGTVLNSLALSSPTSNLSFGNDGVLYLIQQTGSTTYVVNTSTLALSSPITGSPFVTDMATPLFNM